MERKKIAIQETYGKRFQHCYGCGPQNEEGLHLRSYPSQDGSTCICEFMPDKQFTGGVPANLYGGMIAMIFDCHGTASAAWFNHDKNGQVLEENTVIGRYITARLEVDFKSPVPMGKLIRVTASAEEITERKVIVNMEMEADGKIRAKSKLIAVAIKDDM